MPKPRGKKIILEPKAERRNFQKALKVEPIPRDSFLELKSSDPLDVTEEMMENVFDREPESR